ncbi:hypothetical protein PSTG_13635 [Puccinia striiformis f. sp. tritici PST-78]|uniref:Uncharacterized protein n=1 Tax=Puccinia striiformis f. sp. tritici PST-78 TaxID=1165861 RepID=A0A0L0V203_9BASI|nr:hypothetical protein PSTG_13635 [Puccinia striiformis f. sp. tritici PST-78]
MFAENRISYSDVDKLIDMWQTTGVRTASGIICKECSAPKASTPAKLAKKNPRLKKINSDISLVQDPAPLDQSLHWLYETSHLTFDQSPPPLHIYFYMDISTLQTSGASANWPFNLTVGGGPCIRLCLGDTGTVSTTGPSKDTSWVMYSRAWTTKEEKYVATAIEKISANHCDLPGELNFNMMNSLRHQPSGAHCPLNQVNTKLQPQEDHLHNQFTVLESDLAHLDKETLTQSAIMFPTDPCKSCEVSEAPKHEVYEAPVPSLTHPKRTMTTVTAAKKKGKHHHPANSQSPEPPNVNRPTNRTKNVCIANPPAVQSLSVKTQPKRPRPKKLGTVRLKSQETKSISAKVLPEPKETQTDLSNVLPKQSESETISSLEQKTSEPISEKGKIIIRFKVKASSTQPDQALDPIPSCVKPAPPKSAPNACSFATGTLLMNREECTVKLHITTPCAKFATHCLQLIFMTLVKIDPSNSTQPVHQGILQSNIWKAPGHLEFYKSLTLQITLLAKSTRPIKYDILPILLAIVIAKLSPNKMTILIQNGFIRAQTPRNGNAKGKN